MAVKRANSNLIIDLRIDEARGIRGHFLSSAHLEHSCPYLFSGIWTRGPSICWIRYVFTFIVQQVSATRLISVRRWLTACLRPLVVQSTKSSQGTWSRSVFYYMREKNWLRTTRCVDGSRTEGMMRAWSTNMRPE